jgi:hypothetical protein
MVSPRPRHAVPLPTPVTYTALRRVLAAKILVTLVLWAVPALLLPTPWFPVFGLPEPPPAHVIFVRLLGAAYVALVVGYALAWRAPARHPGAILTGVVSNGLAALVIVREGIRGAFESWTTLGACYIWGSAVVTLGLAMALVVTGRPLLKKIAERPRAGSVKVV